MNIQPKRCLVVSPHTDDGEFGCGASIAKMIQQGTEVHYIAFSTCEESVPADFDANILKEEVQQATQLLGIKSQNLLIQNLRVRHFPENRQKVLQILVDYSKDFKPDLVICPASDDIHQDHHTVYQECLRAFKKTTILGYELPWNNTRFASECFINVSEENLKTKLNAILAYKSQSHRSYVNEEFIRGLALIRGIQGGYKFAESFEIFKLSWE
jgi:LmbE family N-acetylglucosaminyl deacetylase